MKEKGRFLKQYRGNKCLNCNVPLDVIDRYCHNCGQINTTKKLSLKDFFNEFFSSIFSYDSRLRHTIIVLLFRPGVISKDYIEGKRIKYANPFRFFLSVSIIFFIIFGISSSIDNISRDFNQGLKEGLKEEKNKDETKKNSSDFTIKNHKKENVNLSKADPVLTNSKNFIKNDTINSVSQKNKQKEVYYSEAQLDTLSFFKATRKRMDTYQSHYKRTNEEFVKIALDSLHHNNTMYNRYLYKRIIKTTAFEENPLILFKFIFDHLPFIIFFFLPFFTLAIWMLYLRRSFNYMEHLVFIFHTQTMFFILMGITILINQIISSEVILGIVLLIFLFYLYKAMRKFYQQGRGKTIVKFLLVNVLFFILASVGSLITIIGSIFIF